MAFKKKWATLNLAKKQSNNPIAILCSLSRGKGTWYRSSYDYAARRNVAGSRPDKVSEFFQFT
jgi:hypothetical protein